MLRLWLLLWRASSEQFLNEKSLPEGARVLTRRAVLDKLDGLGLRGGELTKEELSLHLLARRRMEQGVHRQEHPACGRARGAAILLWRNRCTFAYRGFLPPSQVEPREPRRCNERHSLPAQRNIRYRRERDIAAAYYLRCYGTNATRNCGEIARYQMCKTFFLYRTLTQAIRTPTSSLAPRSSVK